MTFNKTMLTALAMLCSTMLYAQNPAPQKGGVKLFFEKVFLHTDRAVYTPGEDIWFKAYLINPTTNRLTTTSKNLYTELLSPTGKIVTREVVYINNGTGHGDFAIPDALPDGTYRLRAYTNWMRNFGDNFVFEKQIVVTGKSSSPQNTNGKSTANNTFANASLSTNSSNNTSPVIRFFPEGGSLVEDITSIVAVKAEDEWGNGIAISGPILSSAGDTVAKFTCDTLGMGLFTLLPIHGQSYHGKALYKGKAIDAALPAPLASGLAMKILKRDTMIYANITCNAAASAAFTGKTLTLNAKHAGATVIDQPIKLTDNAATIRIPASLLPEGIADITLYDDEHKPHCERLLFVDHPGAAKLTVTTGKLAYASRERTSINIKVTDKGGHPVAGNFSVAAVDAGTLPADNADISAYLLLQSELKGTIAQPKIYFDTTNVNRSRQLDMLMLTQGWRDFVWKRLADTSIKISYLPEQGFTITGMVQKKQSGGPPVAATNVTLNAPKATGQRLFAVQTDATGKYYFDNLQLFGNQNIKISSMDIKGRANGTVVIDSLTKNSLPATPERTSSSLLPASLTAELEKHAASVKNLDSNILLKEVKIRADRRVTLRDQVAVEAGYPDEAFTITDKDGKDFKYLRQYLLYKSNSAKLDPNSDQIIFAADGHTYKPRIIVDNVESPFTEDDPDDVQAHYYDIYYNLPMSSVEHVTIRRLLAGPKPPTTSLSGPAANAMGNSIAGAAQPKISWVFVIYLTLKPGALANANPMDGVTTADVSGYYNARVFYQPLHPNANFKGGKPDMRTTLHWEPEVKTDVTGQATVSYYNADPKTKIRVIVQGVTETGVPLSGMKEYLVK